jgi:predicted transcriptional regulator
MDTAFIRRPPESRLVDALKSFGPQTIEELSPMVGMQWPELLLSIDRLSRTGLIALRQTADRSYLVSLAGTH